MASEPSEKAKGIVLDMLHGLCDASAIDAYVDEAIAKERDRCLACIHHWFLDETGFGLQAIAEIQSGDWPDGDNEEKK